MARSIVRAAGAFLLSVFLFAPSASASSRIYVRIGPPERIVEVRPAPRRGYVWRDGYHRWNGHRYVWVRGRWGRPPYARAVWTSGRWEHERRGWYWVPGHWARS
jgi:hypothetical protein